MGSVFQMDDYTIVFSVAALPNFQFSLYGRKGPFIMKQLDCTYLWNAELLSESDELFLLFTCSLPSTDASHGGCQFNLSQLSTNSETSSSSTTSDNNTPCVWYERNYTDNKKKHWRNFNEDKYHYQFVIFYYWKLLTLHHKHYLHLCNRTHRYPVLTIVTTTLVL